ncbi:MAG: rhamnulokinase family protein [Erysipelotrichia bacterium]|nr:rhamnulokinase family protein [Erysipelotrichia bacterium]
MKYRLAIDLGASNGRGIVGFVEDGKIKTEEIYRFKNGVQQLNNHLVWDVEYLLVEIKNIIKKAFEKYPIESLAIDTWGVDYVLLKGNEIVTPCYAYRDLRTEEIIDQVHNLVPFEILYEHTGSQFQKFNTIYQLYSDLVANRLEGVTDFLMIPEYLMYRLTGVKCKEFTNATTTGLINHQTLEFDEEIIKSLELPNHLFPKLNSPGTIVGELSKDIQEEVGGNCKVMLCATHDTASAVEGIPMQGNQPYISSGTWSLLGVKTARPITDENSMKSNYSNEGGVGYNRYQKNIMGMWLVQNLKEEICPEKDFNTIVKEAMSSTYEEVLDCDDSSLLSPKSMVEAFDKLLRNKPKSAADYFKCAYKSLALGYSKAINELEKNVNCCYEKIYIVGGGAKNQYLNDLTEEMTGKKVIALPIEATVLGNLKIQFKENKI